MPAQNFNKSNSEHRPSDGLDSGRLLCCNTSRYDLTMKFYFSPNINISALHCTHKLYDYFLCRNP